MFRESIIISLLLLAGCSNEKMPADELLEKAKSAYNDGQYRKANKYLRELDSEYSWTENSMDGLLYLAKSTLESGRRAMFHGQKDLLECVQVCNLIIIYKPDYALENNVHMIKMEAYYAMSSFNTQLSDQMAKKVIDTAEEYKKDAKDNNRMDVYRKNYSKIREMSDKCKWYITARAVNQSRYTSKADAGLNLIDLAENDPKYGKKYAELYYRKLERMCQTTRNNASLISTLQQVYAYDSPDLEWTRAGVDLVRGRYDSLNAEDQRRFTQLDKIVYRDRD